MLLDYFSSASCSFECVRISLYSFFLIDELTVVPHHLVALRIQVVAILY
jgi:hypothetical protein